MPDLLTKFKNKDALLMCSESYLQELTMFLPDSMQLPEPKKDSLSYFEIGDKDREPFTRVGSTAIVQVHGVLIHRMSFSYSFATGYTYIRAAVDRALNDKTITHIVFDVDSPGGMVAGSFELADYLQQVKGQKPMAAIVDADCYSGAYLIASQLDKIYVTPTGGAGSIGVLTMHLEVTKMLDSVGYNVTIFRSGKHKAEGNPYEKLSESASKTIQSRIDSSRDAFVSYVAKGRGISEKEVRDTEASVYSADEALSLNLIDGVMAPDDAILAFLNENLTKDNCEEEPEMTTESNKSEGQTVSADTDSARKEGADQERKRFISVMCCEDYVGREKLAHKLLENDSLSADQIIDTLKVVPVAEKAEASSASSSEEADKTSVSDGGFSQAMSVSNPGVHDSMSSEGVEHNPLISSFDSHYKSVN